MEKENITLKKSDYYYELPEELIAQAPAQKRDMSRLMVLDKNTGNIEHRYFHDIVDYLKPGDALVLNNSKVIPARLFAKRYIKDETGKLTDKLGDTHIEILLLKRHDEKTWECIVHPGKKVTEGTKLHFSDKLEATVTKVLDDGNRMIEFS